MLRSRRCPAETIADADYRDWCFLQIHLLKPNLDSIAWSSQQEISGIQIKQFMRLNQDGATLLINSKPLKLVDKFTYLGSNITSTESDVNKRIDEA